MKQVRSCSFVLATLVMGCSAQTSNSPGQSVGQPATVGIAIESKQTTFQASADITIMIRLKNLTGKELDAPTTYWSLVLLLDGKERKRLPKYIGPWNGPDVIIPDGEFGSVITLSEYGITKENLSVGAHTVALKIGDAVSNTLTIKITENR